ncbi:MAG: winged helix-turn-helix domain-containing protein [Methanocellales archaeon]
MKDLLDLISYSEKRKNLLILLQEGPKTLSEIKTRLKVTSTGMLPQIRKLEKRNLIKQVNKEYILTELGEIITQYLAPLIKTLKVIEANEEFWTTHDLKAIPPHLLQRISELGECKLVESSLNSIYELRAEFMENIARSKKISGIFPVYHPMHLPLFLKVAEKGSDITLIYIEDVIERMKNENPEQLKRYIDLKNARMFISTEEIRLSNVTTDCFFSLSLFYKRGDYDHQRDLYSYEPSAVKWGFELFEYYLKKAKPVTDL